MNKRILVIDDEPDIREIVKLSLEMMGGFEVLLARSGAEGLAKAASEVPDAILLDGMMPDMDGATTFKRLRGLEKTRTIPVVMLTAKVQSVDLGQFQKMGVDGVLAKPFDPVTLPAELSRTLGW